MSVTFNRDRKFDLQLGEALINERRLGEIFRGAEFTGSHAVRLELKSETWQWEQTGNICIEFRCDGQPSGIATTEADVWVHELRRDGETLCWLMFPIDRLKEIAREAHGRGRWRNNAGDDGRFDVVLVRLAEILR